jgi:hypothetical protein
MGCGIELEFDTWGDIVFPVVATATAAAGAAVAGVCATGTVF